MSVDVNPFGVINDARARQRRRQLRVAAALVVALIAGICVDLLVTGGQSSTPTVRASVRPSLRPRLISVFCPATAATTGTSQALPSRSILSILGMLHRPATAADQLPANVIAGLAGNEKVLVRFARLAQVAYGHAFYLVPEISSSPQSCQPQEGVQLLDMSPRGGWAAGEGSPVSVIKAQTDTFHPQMSIGPGGPVTIFPFIVPNQIASATIHYPAGKAGGFSRRRLPAATITAHAINNVIVLRVPRGGLQADGAGTTTVRGHDGQIITTLAGI